MDETEISTKMKASGFPKMPSRVKHITGKPDGWTPKSEIEHFEQCPTCGDWFDCRKLEEVMAHLGPHKAKPKQ